MLRFEREVLIADLNERTIEGVIVPYDEVGVIAGREYRFKAGSVRLGRRTPLLVDHDRGQPIGVLAELVEQESGVLARFRVDATPAGDEALTQAASGSRGSLSIGAEVVRSRINRDGVIDVEAGDVVEVSLLALGAFDSAEVTRVAAEADEPQEPAEPAGDDDDDEEEEETPAEPVETSPDQEELELEEPDDSDDAGAAGDTPEGGTMTAAAAAPVIRAERSPAARELLAGEYVLNLILAGQGDREARRIIEAALAESVSTDVAGLLPPTFERTVIGGKDVQRPLYEAFRSRPLPGVGLNVNKPGWTTPPVGAWAADVDADATSSKVVIGSQVATVQRWDWAGAIPWVVVQRSDPSVVDEIYGEAVQSFYLGVEAKVYGELGAAPLGVATTLGAAIAEFYVATGSERAPELIIMAPDVWGEFADAGALTVALAQGGVSAAGGDLSTSFAGIPARTSGTMPAGEVILATRRAVDARTTEPVRLTANAIGALNVELAVVGEGLFDTDYPAELLRFAGVTPAAARLGGGARSSK
jgi:HK97 family phage prohead protease